MMHVQLHGSDTAQWPGTSSPACFKTQFLGTHVKCSILGPVTPNEFHTPHLPSPACRLSETGLASQRNCEFRALSASHCSSTISTRKVFWALPSDNAAQHARQLLCLRAQDHGRAAEAQFRATMSPQGCSQRSPDGGWHQQLHVRPRRHDACTHGWRLSTRVFN